MRITLLPKDKEYEAIKRAAGDVPLTKFILRIVLNNLDNGIPQKESESAGRVSVKHRRGANDRAKSPELARPESNLESASESRDVVPLAVDWLSSDKNSGPTEQHKTVSDRAVSQETDNSVEPSRRRSANPSRAHQNRKVKGLNGICKHGLRVVDGITGCVSCKEYGIELRGK